MPQLAKEHGPLVFNSLDNGFPGLHLLVAEDPRDMRVTVHGTTPANSVHEGLCVVYIQRDYGGAGLQNGTACCARDML